MLRKTLRLPTRFSAVIPSDPDIALPAIEPEPAPTIVEAVAELALPAAPPEPSIDEHVAALLKQLNRVANELSVVRKQEAASATRAIVDLAIRATRHLVGKRIEAGEYGLESMISQALRKLDSQSAVAIVLHPEDLQALRESAHSWANRDGITWEGNPSLSRGSFQVRANDVSLWSDLETRIQEVRDALEQSLEAARTADDDGIADEEAA